MPVLAWFTHHRLAAVGVGTAFFVAVVAAGLWFFVLRSTATPIDLSHALRLYRQGRSPAAANSSELLPPSGVYSYRTSGSEHLNVGGIARTFPAITDMIVNDNRCSTMNWEPFVQHVEGLVECPVGGTGLRIASIPSHEEIAGIQISSNIRCPTDAYLVPPSPQVDERWSTTCHSAGQRVDLTGRVMGLSSVRVGGRAVPALHTQLTLTYSGALSGRNPNDYWILMPDGVILRQRESVELTQSSGPLGSVRYSESLDMTLRSLLPTR